MPEPFAFTPIGWVRSSNRYRFDAPRQAVLAGGGAFLEWAEPRLMAPAAADLAGFDRVWLIFVFDRNLHCAWKPKVRPPVSPGDKRYSVLATRSPHRPNPIGLSAVELRGVTAAGLELGGVDLLDGTPVLDVKPYIPEADAFPEARAGWRAQTAAAAYTVDFTPEAQVRMAAIRIAGGPDLVNFCRVQLGDNPGDRRRKRLTAPERPDECWRLGCRTWEILFLRDDTARRIEVQTAVSHYDAAELAPGAPDPYGDKELHRRFLQQFPGNPPAAGIS